MKNEKPVSEFSGRFKAALESVSVDSLHSLLVAELSLLHAVKDGEN